MSILVLKICGNSWVNESRDKRELSAYRECGAEVAVLAKGEKIARGEMEFVDGYKVYRYTTQPLKIKCPASVNRICSLFLWAKFVRKLDPEVISGHDLLGVLIGWMAMLGKRNKAKLVYDSHEFELGRNKQRGNITRKIIKMTEGFLIKKCSYSIMVNDSIAEEVASIYHLKQRPVVVRSTPNVWEISEEECKKTRGEILKEIKNENNVECFMLLYHGAVTTQRGIETMINIVEMNTNVCGMILGNGEAQYLEELKQYVQEKNLGNRIVFKSAVPISELWKYVGAMDASLMMIEGESKSYYLSLPNKFFESIQSLTPIIASDFPEMKRIIEQYDIGLTCNPNDLAKINECVERLRTDKALIQRYKLNLLKAKIELCWENEKKTLIKAFDSYILKKM